MNITHPFPTELPFAPAELKRDFWLCDHTRNQDPALHFRILLPKSWKPVDVPSGSPSVEEPLAQVAYFRTEDEPRAEIDVDVMHLEREVEPSDWLDLYLEARGEQVVSRRDTDSPGGRVPDVLSRMEVEGEGAVLSRWLVLKDWQRLWVVQCRAYEADYPGFAPVFLAAFSGFKVLNPTDWPLAERLRSFSRPEPADFVFLFPQSWELAVDESSNANVLSLQLNNQIGGLAAGKIVFSTVATAVENSAQHLLNTYLDQLRANDIAMAGLELKPRMAVDGFVETWEASGTARRGEGRVETRVVIGRRPEAWFLIALLGPTRESAAEVWAINKRAFYLTLEYLKTPDLDSPPEAASS